MKNGLFISLEGSEGVGKTTQIKRLNEKLKTINQNIILTREPGGTNFGEKIRELILSSNYEISPITQTLLHYSARMQHIEEIIKPALKLNKIVITDRFADSTIVYQGIVQKIGLEKIISLHNLLLDNFWPNISFFLLLDPEIAHERIIKRAGASDRYEKMGIEFQRKLNEGFIKLAKLFPSRIIIIDASKNIDEITNEIFAKIQAEIQHNSIR